MIIRLTQVTFSMTMNCISEVHLQWGGGTQGGVPSFFDLHGCKRVCKGLSHGTFFGGVGATYRPDFVVHVTDIAYFLLRNLLLGESFVLFQSQPECT